MLLTNRPSQVTFATKLSTSMRIPTALDATTSPFLPMHGYGGRQAERTPPNLQSGHDRTRTLRQCSPHWNLFESLSVSHFKRKIRSWCVAATTSSTMSTSTRAIFTNTTSATQKEEFGTEDPFDQGLFLTAVGSIARVDQKVADGCDRPTVHARTQQRA